MGELSVVIPTLNAAEDLRRALPPLARLEALSLLREVVFADGGSHDATAEIAEASGARLVQAPKGRGSQLAAGAEAARGDWLLFLHADTALEEGWVAAVRTFIETPGNEGRAAYFRFALDDAAPAARRLERIVAFRCRFLGLPYGDQGLLLSRQLYRVLGGYRPLPLMEDVDLVRRIGRRRLVALAPRAVTSAVRYRREGYLRRLLRNAMCLGLYFTGLPPKAIARLYG